MPNSVLGILGGGQLGSLLATSAKKLNIKTFVFSDDKNAPAKNFCDELETTVLPLTQDGRPFAFVGRIRLHHFAPNALEGDLMLFYDEKNKTVLTTVEI